MGERRAGKLLEWPSEDAEHGPYQPRRPRRHRRESSLFIPRLCHICRWYEPGIHLATSFRRDRHVQNDESSAKGLPARSIQPRESPSMTEHASDAPLNAVLSAAEARHDADLADLFRLI